MNPIQNFDTLILNKFQKMSDIIQDWMGWNSLSLSKISLFLFSVFYLFEAFSWFLFVHGEGWRLAFALLLISFLSFQFYFGWFLRAKNSDHNNTAFKNPLVIQYLFLRLAWNFIGLINFLRSLSLVLFTDCLNDEGGSYFLAEIFSLFHNIFVFAFVYFVSCTPRPKKPSKIKKAVSKLGEKISSVGAKPAPVAVQS